MPLCAIIAGSGMNCTCTESGPLVEHSTASGSELSRTGYHVVKVRDKRITKDRERAIETKRW